MTVDHLKALEEFEAELWKIADNLRANSNLASNEYFMPIMGLLFLRQATNRYYAALEAIEADKAAGRTPKRPPVAADFARRRALMLAPSARFDEILKTPKDGNLGAALIAAMEEIERAYPPLAGQLPKDYSRFDHDVLESMMRTFDNDVLRTASGDVFGRIYEYFLAEFSKQGAHDNGEFYTPPSIVQTIVSVIEPEHGIVIDPACGTGGMFVQSSHFIERAGQDPMKRVTFYGHEKNETTAKLAQINLAVNGLEGKIRAGNEAITYYKDPHELVRKCDFVMANPPFNVDEVDAEKVKGDKRLPFGLPGVNKGKKVSNANYLWLSYFYSYLNENGRAGVVMSSQASSAGRDEATVRQKIVETGAVDVMIDIRGNFFYTRTVPCQLWFFDRAKERDEKRRDQVLMLDARNIYRKVSRAVYDFSPEQQQNIAAIVWLYRGQGERFLKLVESYIDQAVSRGVAAGVPLDAFAQGLDKLTGLVQPFAATERKPDPLAETWSELAALRTTLMSDIAAFKAEVASRGKEWGKAGRNNARLTVARNALHPAAERCRDLTKTVDMAVKLAGRVIDTAVKDLHARDSEDWPGAETTRARKGLETVRSEAVEALHQLRYFVKQADWLQDRFPDAKLRNVEGLVKLVDRKEIEAHDWSLTPARYVGVAPEEVDEDFDFEEALRSIHIDLKGLNEEAAELAARIAKNFEELGVRAKKLRLEDLAADVPYAIVGGPFGSKLTSADYVEDGVPVIRGTNLNAGRYLTNDGFVYVSEQKVQDDLFGNLAHSGDIVFTQRGTLGQVALIPDDAPFDTYVVSQSQMKMTVDPHKADARFIYYWFTSRDTIESIISRNSSSGVPHINLTVLRNFEIPVPNKDSQTRIADLLSAYDDLIENNQKRIALLEEAARLLYREWFVHLRFPGHEHTPITNGVPEGWVRKSLGEVADCRLGKMLDQNKNKGELMPYLANVNVRWGAIDLDNLREMRFEGNEIDTVGLRYGDIVMCEGGEPGRCALWKDQLPRMMIQKAIHRIRAHPEVSYLFLYYYLRHKGQSGQLAALFTGATIRHLPREKLAVVQVDIPPVPLMTLFAEQVDSLEKQITVLEGANRRASQARDLLLPRLMSGEIAV